MVGMFLHRPGTVASIRVRMSTDSMKFAAGAAAALSVRLETTPREVPLESLRGLLKSNGAIVPEVKTRES